MTWVQGSGGRAAFFAAVCISATSCKHDTPTATTTAHDAGATAAHADAAAADAASSGAAPVDVATTTDSGTPIAAGSAPAEAGASASIFDRILAKPNDANATPDSLIPVVEKATGAKVAKARRTAAHWVLFQLAPANRTADDQAKAIDAIKATGAFSAVEGDRVMKVQ